MATNIEINGKKYYKITRTVGHKYVNGKRVPVKKVFYGSSERDAKNRYEKWKEEQIRSEYERKLDLDTATLSERAEEYIENVLKVSQRYSTGTKYRYERSYRAYIVGSDLANMVMKDIRPADIQRFYNEADVTMQTIKGINKFLSAFFKWLALNEYADNIMAAVEIPIKPENKRHDGIVIWEDSEIREIVRSMNHVPESSARHRLFFFVHVLLYTGARISEALSLRYSDFEDGVVSIERQCYMGEIKPPKYGSVRQVPMHHKLSQALKAHRAWHEEDMIKNGYQTDYVFTTSTGKLYDPHNIRTALKRFYNSRGIPAKHPHAYRSTFCTQLCRCGVPLEVASSLLGHKSLEITSRHYALVRQETKKDAIERLKYDL